MILRSTAAHRRMAALAGTAAFLMALLPVGAVSALPVVGVGSETAVFVAPGGDDAADGRALRTAFRSLERAEAAVLAGDADTVYLVDGIFRRSRTFTIKPVPRPQRWLAAPDAHPVLDGGGGVTDGLVVTGHDVTVQGLAITNFANNGIVVGDADGVTIRGNRITRIATDAGTRAGILVIQVGRNVVVEDNDVEDTGYAGIGYFASKDGNLAGARIVGNRLARTCGRVPDCGAIYIMGRTPTSAGAVIRGNRITDYGPPAGETKAIYLDDGQSDTEVSGNIIGGRGSYAIHIHGGSGNRVSGNVIDLIPGEPVLFSQQIEGPGGSRMIGNSLTGNTVHAPGSSELPVKYGGPDSALLLRRNRLNGHRER